jgi:hypothetical protein
VGGGEDRGTIAEGGGWGDKQKGLRQTTTRDQMWSLLEKKTPIKRLGFPKEKIHFSNSLDRRKNQINQRKHFWAPSNLYGRGLPVFDFVTPR